MPVTSGFQGALRSHELTAGWARPRIEQVIEDAAVFVERYAVTASQRRLLQTALAWLRSELRLGPDGIDEGPLPSIVLLPLLVHTAITGDEAAARPLAVLSALFSLGVNLADDLADGDLAPTKLPPLWSGYRVSMIDLAVLSLLGCLPQLLLAELPVSAARRLALQRSLATGFLAMIAGQNDDIATQGSDAVAAADVETSVGRKTGEQWAIFATLAARLAGAPERIVARYCEFARAAGTAGQFQDDCYDLFAAPHSRDLASGARTLPIALYLERQTGEERRQFLALLADAQTDATAQQATRSLLLAAGCLRRSAITVELYCQRALYALEGAAPRDPAGAVLRAMVESASFYQAGRRGP